MKRDSLSALNFASRGGLTSFKMGHMTLEHVVHRVLSLFPNILIEDDLVLSMPTVVFGNLSDLLVKSIEEKDDLLMSKFILLINEMSTSQERTTLACLSELVASCYDNLDEPPYSSFVKRLSVIAQAQFEENVRLWNSQFGEK